MKIKPMQKLALAQMKSEQLGIENIKSAFVDTLKLSKQVTDLIKDWSLPNAFSLLLQLAQYQALIPKYKQAVKEVADLDKTEIKALQTFFKDEIDFENDNLEDVIEEGIDIIVEGYELVSNAVKFYIKVKAFVPKIKSVSNKELTARIAA